MTAPADRGPIQVHSLRTQAKDRLRAQIVAGELTPGELHAVGTIAEGLGVSITPVREAVLDLASDGLVEVVRNRGFRVKVLTERDLDEIVLLRRWLEVPAVRAIAAESRVRDDTELRRLAAVTEEAARAGDWVTFLATDRLFHLDLLSYAGSPRLVSMVSALRDQTRLSSLADVAGTEQFLASTREHDALLDAVVAGAADQAATIMDQHLRHARGVWAGYTEEPTG